MDLKTIQYLRKWAISLDECATEIDKHLSCWYDNMPATSNADEYFFLTGEYSQIKSIDSNYFSLEMILASVLNACGDTSKIIYEAEKVPFNNDAHLLAHKFYVYLDLVKKELNEEIPTLSPFRDIVHYAKTFAAIAKELSTLD